MEYFKLTIKGGESGTTEQIHKRLTEEQVEIILNRYNKNELSREQAMELLGLKRRQFFEWLKKYRENRKDFTIEYSRKWSNRKIDKGIEENIIKELKIEKGLIDDPAMTIRFYNYSYIQDLLRKKHQQGVSLPTIIDRAKKGVFTYQDQKIQFMTMR